MENYPLALFLVGGIGLVMLFAQVKLFSIDETLKAILEELRKANETPKG
jgi:hypothetical protein